MSARARGFIEAWHPRLPRGGSCSAGSNRFSMNMSSCCLCCGRFWPASARRGSAHKRPSGRASVERSRASLEITWAMTTLTALTSGVSAITCCSCRYAEAFRMPATATSAHSNTNDFRTCWAARLATKARGPADRWRRAAVVARAGAQAKAREAQRHAARRSNRLIRENERPPQGDWNHGGGLLIRVFKGNTQDVRYAMRPTRSTRCCCCA
jgi:hypothetical protein